MSKRNIIIIGFLVVIVIVGIVLILSGGSQVAAPSAEPSPVNQGSAGIQPPVSQTPAPVSQENVVTYTDSGFSPSTITVSKATTVTFKNMSSENFHPASDPHPIHNGYPTTGGCVSSTFDACAAIPPGGSWSFTFDIVGTWGYHNHLNPVQRGTVIVQ